MTPAGSITTQAQRAERLRQLHAGPDLLVLPNAWDALSARAVEAAGFPVVATTSAGVAEALGYADHEQAPVEEMLAALRRIASAVAVPVTADMEAGYGLDPAELAERVIAAGAVGLNLEDSDHRPGRLLVDAEAQAERLAAVKAAGQRARVDLVLNARIDVHLRQVGAPEHRLEEALRRARLYRQAGADGVYPIGVCDEPTIRAFLEQLSAPLNILVRPGCPPLAHLAILGVRRASLGPFLVRASVQHLRQLLDQLGSGADVFDGMLAG